MGALGWFIAIFMFRYKDDNGVGKKIPVMAAAAAEEALAPSPDSDEDKGGGSDAEKNASAATSLSSSRRRKRPRCLLRKHCDEKLADPVLSTLSVNKDLG